MVDLNDFVKVKIFKNILFILYGQKKVPGFWSLCVLPQTRISAFLVFFFLLLWNDVQLQQKLLDWMEFFRAMF